MIAKLSACALLGLLASHSNASPSVAYGRISVCETVAHVVTVNLADPRTRITVALARNGRGSSESFKSIVSRTRPSAAITGTFFDTRTLIPTGDIALCGTLVHSGCVGSALCIDQNNRATIVPLGDGRKNRWAGYQTVLCAGPTLTADNRIAIALKHEGFRGSLHASTRRTAVGISSAGKLLLVAINRKASLYGLAKTMLALGARDSVCLDGGSSTGLFHEGRFLAAPSRQLTNVLVVYARSEVFESARESLAPAALLARSDSRLISDVASLASSAETPAVVGAER